MRWFIDRFDCDGTKVYCSGWALPEHQGDPIIVYVNDQEGNHLPVQIEYIHRPDCIRVMLGKEGGYDLYGFSFEYTPANRANLDLLCCATEFTTDYSKIVLHVQDAYTRYKKEQKKKKRS